MASKKDTTPTTPITKPKERKERVVRSKEERIAILESKIVKHKSDIAALEAKIEAIKNPKRSSVNSAMKAVMEQAKSLGMTPQEIAEKLGLSISIPETTNDAQTNTNDSE